MKIVENQQKIMIVTNFFNFEQKYRQQRTRTLFSYFTDNFSRIRKYPGKLLGNNLWESCAIYNHKSSQMGYSKMPHLCEKDLTEITEKTSK